MPRAKSDRRQKRNEPLSDWSGKSLVPEWKSVSGYTIVPTLPCFADLVVINRKRILSWLSLSSFSEMHETLQGKRVSGTGQWLLDKTEFRDWVSVPGAQSQLLYCVGIGILP